METVWLNGGRYSSRELLSIALSLTLEDLTAKGQELNLRIERTLSQHEDVSRQVLKLHVLWSWLIALSEAEDVSRQVSEHLRRWRKIIYLAHIAQFNRESVALRHQQSMLELELEAISSEQAQLKAKLSAIEVLNADSL